MKRAPTLRPRFFRPFSVLVAAALLTGPAVADAPVLHEYFPRDDAEDLSFGATTADGRLPAAIDTPSGVIPAPDPSRSPLAPDHVYGGRSEAHGTSAEYRIDRNTSRPSNVEYDDPFNPSVTPFKRAFAYDAVDRQLALSVADPKLRPLEVGGSPQPGDDQFYADLVIDLVEGKAVRIPSVGPGTRALALQTFPETKLVLLHDGADNWFVRASEGRRIRLTLQLAISRAVFGSPFPDIAFDVLPSPPPLPAAAAEAASRTLQRIGVSRTLRLREAVAALVGYFRGFAPSTDMPEATDPVGLYEELATSRKGVCRHRAYAFVITALHLGIPVRFVRNEAHAWVEVSDGRTWHRVDLGGAAGHLDLDPRTTGFQHVPPADPQPWPNGAESGFELARRAREDLGLKGPGPGVDAARLALGHSLVHDPSPGSSASRATLPFDASTMTLEILDQTIRRGEPLRLRGRVEQAGRPCAGARVDVMLHREGMEPVPLGSLPTGHDGAFAGAVTARLDLDVGDYDVVVTTPGSARCGLGEAR
ncbi:MAG: transglutaminase domain-containing protein [Polyangiaceae bacterium]|nr:transglutaminase domain-containing protein [Polyangiaceae bacterium]